ncbi:peptide chain release factor N(5)-glutamine methyltransferase [Cytophaga sp. FL35]|uniref:peptide chain release factor N(5)-glutamine methyltransferase n=1 Tax=Cytophaga sp. FL35 TaxID=1904456 RepID=UPI001653D4B1|nr:peptide chain release factor N(5)-glutamine methyltransferase [Cytophaga sp. FL35]MBC6998703.1 peptide chain release factor N(5)-glutamine methyltransferase [Cytophaga sp. FL35]
MQLKEIKQIFHKELEELYPLEEIDSFFYILIEHYLNLERFVLALQPNLTITKEEEQTLFEALSGLKLKKPIQHIIGTAHFMDLDLVVNEHVLIPRPETEELVRWILKDCENNAESFRILDMGTGSGCIPISLGKNLKSSTIHALDISQKALRVAKRNAKIHQVEIEFIQADMLAYPSLDLVFDLIVSNPPYVRDLEKKEMHGNVLEHEPHLALFVSNDDPLLFYRNIMLFCEKHLKIDGCLYLEINQYLGKEMVTLLQEHNFSEIELRKDMFGNDRMVKAVK